IMGFSTAPKDYGAISGVVEDRLDVAVGYAHHPAGTLIAGSSIVDALPRGERARVHAALSGVTLPRTPMHGDMHMFNFCKARDGFVLIDSEDYVEHGSYILDYVDFHVQNSFFAQEALWFPFLAGLDTLDPSAVWAAGRLGIAPQTLWLLYMLVKLENMVLRFGGLDSDAGRRPRRAPRRRSGVDRGRDPRFGRRSSRQVSQPGGSGSRAPGIWDDSFPSLACWDSYLWVRY
nr:hypothetical protein [Paracoccaceae bacterium]